MASVALLGGFLVLITVLVAARTMTENRAVGQDRSWEQAVHVAEAGVDQALYEISGGGSVAAVPLPSTPTKEDVVAAAKALAAADPTEVRVMPEGDVVVLASSSTGVAYAVGFTPGVGSSFAKKRVVFVEYEVESDYSPETALLFGGDLKISGDLVIKGDQGGLHSNGELDLSGKVWADDCVGASGGFVGDDKDIKKTGPGCPDPEDVGSQPTIPVPDMAARDLWPFAEYQMCPDGKVRVGPAHATLGSTAGSSPCESTAPILGDANGSPYKKWKMTGTDASLGAKWDYDSNQPSNGSFYFYHGSVVISPSPANWEVMVVTEADGSACSKVGGDITISGNIGSVPYPGSDVGFFADRDLDISGNKNAAGLFVAMEQLNVSANPSIEGAFIVADECDSPDSNVHETEVSGNPTLTYDGGLTSPFGFGGGSVSLLNTGEL